MPPDCCCGLLGPSALMRATKAIGLPMYELLIKKNVVVSVQTRFGGSRGPLEVLGPSPLEPTGCLLCQVALVQSQTSKCGCGRTKSFEGGGRKTPQNHSYFTLRCELSQTFFFHFH